MSQFFSFVEKHDCFNHWVKSRPSLKASELKVLFRLLAHQNPQTGRCDPSIARLSEDTGVCRRTVRKAIKGLEEREAIRVLLRSRGRRNKYRIVDVARKLSSNARANGSKTKEPGFPKEGVMRSPKKEKKKERKEIGGFQRPHSPINKANESEQAHVKQKRLETCALAVFEERGMTLSDLVSIPSKEFQLVSEAFVSGEMTLEHAALKLLELTLGPKA